jgi:hypothetical protein
MCNSLDRFVRIQDKLRKAVGSLDYFTQNEWIFSNKNLFALLENLSPEDRKVKCWISIRDKTWPIEYREDNWRGNLSCIVYFLLDFVNMKLFCKCLLLQNNVNNKVKILLKCNVIMQFVEYRNTESNIHIPSDRNKNDKITPCCMVVLQYISAL